MNLLSSLLGKGPIVYTDNFYSSPQLLDKSTLASGTVRKNRKKNQKKFPQNLDMATKMSRSESKFAYHRNLCVVGMTIKMSFAYQHCLVIHLHGQTMC